MLDGGALLQRIPWQHGSTFGAILDTYVDFVSQNYAQRIIIFARYESFSTKDMTHKHWSKGKKSVSVVFGLEMKLTATKDVFLCNPSNKQFFIQVLGQRLSAQGCKVLHEQSDADVLIVKTAIKLAA